MAPWGPLAAGSGGGTRVPRCSRRRERVQIYSPENIFPTSGKWAPAPRLALSLRRDNLHDVVQIRPKPAAWCSFTEFSCCRLARDMDETGRKGHVPYARVTVAVAAAILGVNVVTVRRMIKRGQLEAERVHRPQGSAYLVTLPQDRTGDATSTEQPAQDMSRTQGTPGPAADAMVSLIQTTIGTILGPLVGQLDAQRQTIDRQAEQLTAQAETIGRLSADLEHATAAVEELSEDLDAVHAQNSTLVARSAPETVKPTIGALLRRWRLLWPLWVVLVVLTVLVAAIAVVVRLVVR